MRVDAKLLFFPFYLVGVIAKLEQHGKSQNLCLHRWLHSPSNPVSHNLTETDAISKPGKVQWKVKREERNWVLLGIVRGRIASWVSRLIDVREQNEIRAQLHVFRGSTIRHNHVTTRGRKNALTAADFYYVVCLCLHSCVLWRIWFICCITEAYAPTSSPIWVYRDSPFSYKPHHITCSRQSTAVRRLYRRQERRI